MGILVDVTSQEEILQDMHTLWFMRFPVSKNQEWFSCFLVLLVLSRE